MTVKALIEKLYGVITDKFENPITDTVGTSATQLLKNDPDRLNYTLVNLGTTPVFVAFTPDPSANKGIHVPVSGGSVSLDWKDDGVLVCYPIWAISSSQAKVFLVGLRQIG